MSFADLEVWNYFVLCAFISHSQWPQGRRRGSVAEFVRWECEFKSRHGHECASFLCVFRKRSLCRADHSSRGVLPNVVCLSVIVKPR
jgi:hypothetical protein